jgi:hypothetical protein
MVSEQRSVGRVVERYDDGLSFDANIPFEAFEKIAGQMGCIPLDEGRASALAQPVNDGLGDQYRREMAVTNVQVERAGTVPTQCLIEFEELLDMPCARVPGWPERPTGLAK